MQNIIYKPKILFYTETKWALGRIHKDLKEYLSEYFDITIYDWSITKPGYSNVFSNYDLVITTSNIATDICNGNDLFNEKLLKDNIVGVVHSELELEWVSPKNFDNVKDLLFIHDKDINKAKNKTINKNNMLWTPTGVNTNDFEFKQKTRLEKIGFIGNESTLFSRHGTDVKNKKLLKDIFENINDVELVYSGVNKDLNEMSEFYNSVDALIITSKLEAGPLGAFESGYCGTPIFTTKVGNAQYIKNAIFFNSKESAIDRINEYKNNSEKFSLLSYNIHNEIANYWTYDNLKYEWVKAIYKIL